MRRELCVLIALAACNGQAATNKPTNEAPNAARGDEAPAFRVDVAPPASCARGAACEARLVLTAVEPYKVNAEYPFKFVADAAPGITVDGPGAFAHGDGRTGTLTIRFRADAAGTARVTGTFKLSVCTDEICKIEAPKVAFDVPVT